MYEIEIVPEALEELEKIPAYYRKIIEKAVETQLAQTPDKETRNRKRLCGLVPGFEYEEPLWELRVGDWRVFYDVGGEEKNVIIRAVRFKAGGKTTKEIV